MKALVIEDSKEIVESVSLIFQLRWPGAKVVSTESGKKGIEMVETESPDVVILDIGLPDMEGFEVLRQIRSFSDVPVVILTGRAISEIDKIKGFELRADDYVIKPFSPGEFLVRVKNALTHARISSAEAGVLPLAVNNLVIDFANRNVSFGGMPVSLTPSEYKLLCYLARNAGRVLSHESILRVVWGEGYEETDVIKTCVYELRRKLAQAGANPEIITSERGYGYQFVTLV
ncbi:MAG: response regulator transcription factor [Dehalococcoidia bacterium]|nr:response regulator transcription factor [Dehalococcoidia bacterium]